MLERIKDAWVGALLLFQLGPFVSKLTIKWWRGWHRMAVVGPQTRGDEGAYLSLTEV